MTVVSQSSVNDLAIKADVVAHSTTLAFAYETLLRDDEIALSFD
jgi:hypothetical protein